MPKKQKRHVGIIITDGKTCEIKKTKSRFFYQLLNIEVSGFFGWWTDEELQPLKLNQHSAPEKSSTKGAATTKIAKNENCHS